MSDDLLNALIDLPLQEFIRNHENDDEQALILKHKTIYDVPAPLVASQISGRRKAKSKLPTFYKTPGIIYPPGKNLEQSSSEQTARYKSTLVGNGNCFADLTAGFGVDTFFLSKIFNETHYIEQSIELLTIAKHNHHCLGNNNIVYHQASCEEFLRETQKMFDLVYIDPSRRNEGNRKVFRLADCTPNVATLLPALFHRASVVLIKVSPLLDIQQGLKELSGVEKVHVVSVSNECKELLFLCRKDYREEPVIETVNILPNELQRFQFNFSTEKNANSLFSDPGIYLYEPNASVLKGGAFKSIATKFNLRKMSPSTHLYTSDDLTPEFPGRIFKLIHALKPDEKDAKRQLPDRKVNVMTRNYPLTAEQLKKKMKLTDGGEQYLIGFSGVTTKFVMLADRIK